MAKLGFERGDRGGADAWANGDGIAADLAVVGRGAPAHGLDVDRGFARQQKGADPVGVAVGRPVGFRFERMDRGIIG